MERFVYSFNEGTKDMHQLLGAKGVNLAEMTKLGLPVPFGFTITTKVCQSFFENGQALSDEIVDAIYGKIGDIEQVMGRQFGDKEDPLLVSVRYGAEISMPGVVESVLNIGLNDETVKGLAAKSGDTRFAYDCYKRFVQMFGTVVYGIKSRKFERALAQFLQSEKLKDARELDENKMQQVVEMFKGIVKEESGFDLPQDPFVQLLESIKAIFLSWNRPSAAFYRKVNGTAHMEGTAVNVQAMVFGNKGENSCTGIAFTRNPIDGSKKLFGEFIINAQGEEVSRGVRNAKSIEEFKEYFPENGDKLKKIATVLEKYYRDMQDITFAVEEGKLYILQSESCKRTADAAVKVAVDMKEEGLITKKEAVMRLTPDQINQIVHPTFDGAELERATKVSQGLPSSPGAACGRIYFNTAELLSAVAKGEKAILVKAEILQEDLEGLMAAEGILCSHGGTTDYVAVVARGVGKCYISSCSKMKFKEQEGEVAIGDKTFHRGDFISINGTDGKVYQGKIGTVRPKLSEEFQILSSWADEERTLKVRANIDNPGDAKLAVEFGAGGVGLCRTEHMFYGETRLTAMRKMILSDGEAKRREALKEILPYQKKDFKSIFEILQDRPVTIRLLDPPFHEFLPASEDEIKELATQVHITYDRLSHTIEKMREFNPMLGHRGCRLAVTYPEIAEMQAEAIISAAIEVRREKGYDIVPEIMIPLVGNEKELKCVVDVVRKKIKEIMAKEGADFKYLIGTMIEVPRAAMIADKLAEQVDFFSFGTNDLTQMVYGFSREDTGKLIREYRRKGIFMDDPFQTLDVEGVGPLIETAIAKGKEVRPNIRLGVCGEHGGDPKSIEYFHNVGLGYVSCSPYRVPIARLAAAQSAIRKRG